MSGRLSGPAHARSGAHDCDRAGRAARRSPTTSRSPAISAGVGTITDLLNAQSALASAQLQSDPGALSTGTWPRSRWPGPSACSSPTSWPNAAVADQPQHAMIRPKLSMTAPTLSAARRRRGTGRGDRVRRLGLLAQCLAEAAGPALSAGGGGLLAMSRRRSRANGDAQSRGAGQRRHAGVRHGEEAVRGFQQQGESRADLAGAGSDHFSSGSRAKRAATSRAPTPPSSWRAPTSSARASCSPWSMCRSRIWIRRYRRARGRRRKCRQRAVSSAKDRANLAYSIIRSPVSGVVVSRQVDTGPDRGGKLPDPDAVPDRPGPDADADRHQRGRSRHRQDPESGSRRASRWMRFTGRRFEGKVKQIRLESDQAAERRHLRRGGRGVQPRSHADARHDGLRELRDRRAQQRAARAQRGAALQARPVSAERAAKRKRLGQPRAPRGVQIGPRRCTSSAANASGASPGADRHLRRPIHRSAGGETQSRRSRRGRGQSAPIRARRRTAAPFACGHSDEHSEHR